VNISNSKIIGAGVSYETYSRQEPDVKRGHPRWIMSRGELMEFAHCPARWLKGFKGDDTKSTDWGSLIDCLILTQNEFDKRYAVSPATYQATVKECPSCGSQSDSEKCSKCKTARVSKTVEKKWNNQTTFCKDWNAEQEKAGKLVVKAEEHEEAKAAVQAIGNDAQAFALIHSSETQVMVIGEAEVNGITIPLRCLIDLVPHFDSRWGTALADFKTTTGASLDFWSGQVFKHSYDAQAALELDLYNAALPEPKENRRTEFRHIIQESFPPYQTARRILTEEFISIGRMKYQNALTRYAECLTTGEWPDYETGMGLDGWSFQAPESWVINKLTQ
jgi:PDDEXK-like domain of unknown function (DUF3799)